MFTWSAGLLSAARYARGAPPASRVATTFKVTTLELLAFRGGITIGFFAKLLRSRLRGPLRCAMGANRQARPKACAGRQLSYPHVCRLNQLFQDGLLCLLSTVLSVGVVIAYSRCAPREGCGMRGIKSRALGDS